MRCGWASRSCSANDGSVWVNAMYRIREVDGQDDDIADTLGELHRLTFLESAAVPEFDFGQWWLAFRGNIAVAFAGLIPSTHVENAGYFCRVGVCKATGATRCNSG